MCVVMFSIKHISCAYMYMEHPVANENRRAIKRYGNAKNVLSVKI